MHQAHNLEQMMNVVRPHHMRTIAITSGKGGVGKSNISANLAFQLAQKGKRVGILDADIGLANLDLLFGVSVKYNLLHALRGEVSLKSVIYKIEENLFLIPGDSGEEILRYANDSMLEHVLSEESVLDSLDYLIIDTGAGIGGITQGFLRASDMLLVITTPEPSALVDAYTMIKLNAKSKQDIGLIVNMAQNVQESKNVFTRMQGLAKEYINALNLHYLGYLPESKEVSHASRNRALFSKVATFSNASLQLKVIVHALLNLEQKIFGTPNGVTQEVRNSGDYSKSERKMLKKTKSAFSVFLRRLIASF